MDSEKIPSFTSYGVARGSYAVAKNNPALVVDQSFLPTLDGVIKKTEEIKYFRKFKLIPNFSLPFVIGKLGIKGICLHYILRKNYIERKLREFLSNGGKQVVIIGGGLDTLGIRIANEFDNLIIVEVDRAATSDIKKSFVENAQSKIIFNSSNLDDKPLEKILSEIPEFDFAAPSFFACEGVLMYLKPETVDEIFQFFSQRTAPKSFFVFTALEELENIKNDKQFMFMKKFVKSRNEKFLSAISPDQIKNYKNINLVEKFTYKELQKGYRSEKYINSLSDFAEYICYVEKM